jgi:predicted PurR-regulated permease PerM
MTTLKLPVYARIALVLHALLLILFFAYETRTVLIPLVFAFLVAILLYPLTRLFEKWHLGRGISALLSVLLFIIFISSFCYFFISQIVSFSKDFPKLESRFIEMLNNVQNWIANKYAVNNKQQMDYINKSASGIINTIANSVGTTFLGVFEVVILTIFFFVFTFFILYHRGLLSRFVLAFFKPSHNEKVNTVIATTRSMINAYVLGLLTEIVIVALLNFIALIIFGIKYALLMSVLCAVLNVIPYLGIYTSMVISMLITLANGTPAQALTVGIAFIVVHFIDANIILPRIVGKRVKMNPLITIIAVLLGHLLWGIPGMFLFIPITAILRIISENVPSLKPWAILIGEDGTAKP